MLRMATITHNNLYGPGDNFDLASSHVVPALIRNMQEAKLASAASVPIWGTGKPRREFLHVDDLADAIRELAELVRKVAGNQGELRFDRMKLEGTQRKVLDTFRLAALGWRPRITLQMGLANVYAWYCAHGPRIDLRCRRVESRLDEDGRPPRLDQSNRYALYEANAPAP